MSADLEVKAGDEVVSPQGNLIINMQPGKQIRLRNTYWEDLRFPASGINPPGAAADPTVDTTDGRLIFSASLVNTIAMQAQMPHQEGSAIKPHIHWSSTGTDTKNVKWELKTHEITSIGDIPMEGKTFSCMLLLILSRLGNDAADTLTDTVKMNEFDIHYEVDGFGTAEEYSMT